MTTDTQYKCSIDGCDNTLSHYIILATASEYESDSVCYTPIDNTKKLCDKHAMIMWDVVRKYKGHMV